MNEFDQNIVNISDNICKNIAYTADRDRGFVSQNILNNLRNLVEAVDQRIYSERASITPNKHEDIKLSVKHVASRGDLRFLGQFHHYLQAAVSHFSPNEDGATRLMLKYYEGLLRIRGYVKENFGLDILQNIEEFPLDQDASLREYYEKIARKLEEVFYSSKKPSDRFYIQKRKPFFVGGQIYYELTVVPADNYSSKFNRFTVFSKKEIPDYYATKLSFIDSKIDILGREMPVRIVDKYVVAIRPVEFTDLSKILNMPKVGTRTQEYYEMMNFLTTSGMSLSELVRADEGLYDSIKGKIQSLSNSNNLFLSLDRCRQLVKDLQAGGNIISYLLLRMRHHIMEPQIDVGPNFRLSGLFLKNKCIPFDTMPFDASLVEHNPTLFDVFSSISSQDRDHELLSRRIRINTEQNVQLFTPTKDVEHIGDVVELSKQFNSRLIPMHRPSRSLIVDKNRVFIKGYVADTVEIIRNLLSRRGNGIRGYHNSVATWLQTSPEVDCAEKKDILQNMFAKHDLALIYGAAGTGKTTLIKHISSLFADYQKLYLANTNPAIDNLQRKIKVRNCHFSTIASSNALVENSNYAIVFIDECSTVGNRAMKNLLQKLHCQLLVLVGDIYQIQSIKFGNWFSLARYFMDPDMIYELKTPYRSKKSGMIELWNKVRLLDERTEEYIALHQYASELDDSIFTPDDSDEVILCLNYDGLYGINNINRFLQSANPQPAITWGAWTYKIGDPVIFNEKNRFHPTLYNNLKGWIRGIEKTETAIQFDVEIDMALNELGAKAIGLELLDCQIPGHSMIRFSVDHYVDDDAQEKRHNEVVPFQVAYAISIHKAQGLEYNSVKVIVTREIEELITHNIFYTAITRARETLKIYWTPETQHEVLSAMKPASCKSDAHIIAHKYGIQIQNDNAD